MTGTAERPGSFLAKHWGLEHGLDFLNHGSFGACPTAVLEEQAALRAQLERQPVGFFVRRLTPLLDAARNALAEFVGADPDGLVPVPNATTGVNSVLRSLDLRSGDELLTTDHVYGACRNALDFVARRAGARLVVVPVAFPLRSADRFVERLLDATTERTRLVLIDHVTSPTGLVLPVGLIVSEMASRGIDVLIDGAHAPGMLDLDVGAIGAAYYTGNCHKWICAPKGAAFLYVREDLRDDVRPLTISHGATRQPAGRSRFRTEFDWVGTDDPTAFLSVPAALRCIGEMVEGGWPEVRRRNHELALRARALVADKVGLDLPCPDEMIGTLAALQLPDRPASEPAPVHDADPLGVALLERHRIEIPVFDWPAPPHRIVRLSAQLYNDISQYERLAAALKLELGH